MSAAASTKPPRRVLISIAPGRINPMASSSMRCIVSGVSGQWRVTTSALAKKSAAAISAMGVAAIVVFLGGLLMLRMARPMVQRIQEVQQRFRNLLESAPDSMVVVNVDGEIVLVNQQAVAMFGYAAEDLVGSPIERLIPERFRARHPQMLRSFFDSPSTRPLGAGLQLYGQARDGREFPIDISLSPIETEDGLLVASSMRDVTERKEAEARAEQERQAREEAERERLAELEKKRKEEEQRLARIQRAAQGKNGKIGVFITQFFADQ